MAGRFHSYLRSLPGPCRRRPAPSGDPEHLGSRVLRPRSQPSTRALADRAADVGVERFVLDDGWFRNRRDDSSGLGDWYVDEKTWPDGLHPLVDHVRALGMEFGLWVEPEMVNPDSDLARAHPDWILATGGRQPVLGRKQQVLNLARPDAYSYIRERMVALLDEYPISYLKWDHNRDLVDAGQYPGGEPRVHAPDGGRLCADRRAASRSIRQLEIESCSSGGARIDFGILRRTDRVWASDSNDALERQSIQRWTGLLIPARADRSPCRPATVAHVGPPARPVLPRRHGLVRALRHRVGHRLGE